MAEEVTPPDSLEDSFEEIRKIINEKFEDATVGLVVAHETDLGSVQVNFISNTERELAAQMFIQVGQQILVRSQGGQDGVIGPDGNLS